MPHGPQKKLLVIDDDNLMREMIAMAAGQQGFDCYGAGECVEAERILKEQAPDIVLLDLLMPDRDGIEWINELARRSVRTRLILHSGYDRRVLESAALLAVNLGLKVLGILEKPFAMIDLVRLLNRDLPAVAPLPVRPQFEGVEILAAIQNHQIEVHYQPQVDARTARWTGMEALVRWNHPEHGLIFPAGFIHVAESAGFGLQLTQEVMEQALTGYARIVETTGFRGYLSINVSAAALVDPEFPDQVQEQVLRSGVSPGNLVFELTETAMARDLDVAMGILTRLRLRGFSLSIDDFGTGYSSYEMLYQLPFNELKIEVEFVHAARIDTVARAIVENSITLARQLGIVAVAEGVETWADWNWLQGLGCDRAQGHLIGLPMPADELIAWASHWPSPEFVGGAMKEAPVLTGPHPVSRT